VKVVNLYLNEAVAVVKSQYPTLEAAVVTAKLTSPSKLYSYLLITRKLKAYDEVEPHDALWLVIAEDGQYKLMTYEKALETGTVSTPFTVAILARLGDAEWEVCPGVKNYLAYKSSIGYDLSRVSMWCWPPDTARDTKCGILYAKHSTRKSPTCEVYLPEVALDSTKREHDQLSPAHKAERQQVCSAVQFDILHG